MDTLKPIAPKDLIKVLGLLSYIPVRQKGSHVILKNTENRKITVVPIHPGKDIGVGLLSRILNEVGLSKEDYFKLLEKV